MLALDQVHAHYGKSHVLHGVSLRVERGEVVGLLGRNGVGKSTTLKAVMGLLRPSGGRVALEDRDITGFSPHQLARMGIAWVPEDRRIFRLLTVFENLRTGLDRSGVSESRRNELLEKVYASFPVLAERRRQAGGTLSGGEQQMLAIARALIARPRLLLLDEPSLGLAPKMQVEVARLIAEINASGVGILLVEQNAAMALDLAQHGYVMENGKVVLDGSAAALKGDKDIREFYLGLGGEGARSYRHVKLYRRRKRWLS